MQRTVSIPVSVLRKLQTAARAAAEAHDALEDFLLANDPQFLRRMRAARASHRAGRTKPLTSGKLTGATGSRGLPSSTETWRAFRPKWAAALLSRSSGSPNIPRHYQAR